MSSERGYHHGDLREALIEQAIASVNAVGADHLSLRAVAAAVGVSPSAAYHHFSDKEELLAAVKDRGFEQLDCRLLENIGTLDESNLDPQHLKSLMQAGALAYIDFAIDNPYWFSIMFSGTQQVPRPPYMETSMEHLKDIFASRNGITFEDRALTEDVLIASVHGIAALVVEGRMDRDRVPAALEILSTLMLGPGSVNTKDLS
ncbi:MAG: TetR/AcrR family transcriptional regulator [Candidatus Nanopelagicales bacterium]|nr:TetR/AcrR family transcriptional regulator [Candidatus Nanopelagicales bacterium]